MLDKTYEPQNKEKLIYQKWEENNCFKPKTDKNKNFKGENFSMIMPPPNITGQLHIGHALNNTTQDFLIRYKRMNGYNAVWIPGTDHASIATEVKIIDALRKEGLIKEELGRDGFLKRAWQWNDQYGGRIKLQLRTLGCSCDWDRCAFTMDKQRQKSVLKVFKDLYDEGLIYQGKKLINWCPCCKTALSDAEVEHEDENSSFWHIRYPYADGNGYIVVATTRPETLFGDVCIAVNPEDYRYSDKIGKMLKLPATDRVIPLIADEYVEKDFGTGAVKITPAHDANDYEVGLRHKFEPICVMNNDGTMNELCGKFANLDRYECRKQLISYLEENNLIEKIEPYKLAKAACYRCHNAVEPMISKQWFMNMNDVAKQALEAVYNGQLEIVPNKVEKIYRHWLTNIRDWCISRQLWWGHRIPAYYCEECDNVMVETTAPNKCSKCGSSKIHQDDDVLDTWFSSALWPFSTLGYPEQTEDLSRFFPTSTLVTAQDIIFFWVARMVMLSKKTMGNIPFSKVLINGIVRDDEGKKMSKSSNNGVDPIEIIEKYGADALRFSLLLGNGTGNDFKFSETKILEDRKFINKVFNSGKFLELCLSQAEEKELDRTKLNIYDKWIYTKLQKAMDAVKKHMDNLDVCQAVTRMYDFVWDNFCDYYIELTKPYVYSEDKEVRAHAVAVLKDVYINILKLLHPIIPFITEDIYSSFENGFLMEQDYATSIGVFEEETKQVEDIINLIQKIREVRLNLNVAPAKKITLVVNTAINNNCIKILNNAKLVLAKMTNIENISFVENITDDFVNFVTELGEFYFYKNEVVDTEKERERLNKDLEKINAEMNLLGTRLNNPNFINRAPAELVKKEQDRFEFLKQSKLSLESKLKDLN
ncbi:MAG: valine--tRNA ligase [Clostridia bacterium]|nr:valine--tRNA ligase [Clostridia bacterium]